ncbi:MAG: TIGR02301 family protein [Hyphomicrobiales bacterium]|nr:TIGR02301 family protein [Hyphomicrobiales bacterium]
MISKISIFSGFLKLHGMRHCILPGIYMLAILATFQPLATCAQKKGEAVSEKVQTKIKTLPPAYNNEMLRLAEIVGALHYLRELCGANEKLLWRDQMANIIESEDPNPKRKAELISRFNRGFRTYQEIYRKCTPNAIEAVNLYLRQGTKLAGEISGRFGR